ncbi:MAG: hypothetical protein ABI904_10955 [Chloroflexota bacterium]
MITYGLGTYTIQALDKWNNPETPKASINIPIEISEEEHKNLLDAISKVGSVFRYTAIFSATIWNYDDLATTVNSYLQAFIQKDSKFLGNRNITLNINKEVLNVLTSFRFYLDFIDENLHKDFGKDSGIVENFGSDCSTEYDNNFSYRLIYHLRNFAQHKGLVISSVKFSKFLDEERANTVRQHLTISVNRNDIIEDKKFKKEIKAELTNYPEAIDIIDHLLKWISSLTRIHNQLIQRIIPTRLNNALFIIEQVRKLDYNKDDNQVIPILSIIDHSKDNIKDVINPSFVPLPIEDAQRIIEYCKEHNLTAK